MIATEVVRVTVAAKAAAPTKAKLPTLVIVVNCFMTSPKSLPMRVPIVMDGMKIPTGRGQETERVVMTSFTTSKREMVA